MTEKWLIRNPRLGVGWVWGVVTHIWLQACGAVNCISGFQGVQILRVSVPLPLRVLDIAVSVTEVSIKA